MTSNFSSAITEPYISFRQAAIKIVWANELIKHLNAEIVRFIQAKPYEITLAPDPDGGGYVFGARITQPTPLSIPCLAGDICMNLRSSLDYCFMGVKRSINLSANRNGGAPFPTNRKGMDATIRNALKPEANDEITLILTELYGDRIKSHQDFAAGGNRTLCALNDLANWQKHNLLIPAFNVTKLADDAVLESDDGGRCTIGGARIGGNAIFMSGNARLHQEGEPTVEVTVEGKHLIGRREVVPLLVEFSQQSAEALKAFCEAFPSPHNPTFE